MLVTPDMQTNEWNNYELGFTGYTNRLEITATKGSNTSSTFSVAEVRVYGSLKPQTKSAAAAAAFDPTGFTPVDWTIDNSDPESSNPDAYCDESEFMEVSGCGYLNTYARKSYYDTIYGWSCDYYFKPYDPEGCRYGVFVKWPYPPQGETIRDYFILQVTSDYYYSQQYVPALTNCDTWVYLGSYWDAVPNADEGNTAYYHVTILHPTYTPTGTYTLADTVRFVLLPNTPDPPTMKECTASTNNRLNIFWYEQPSIVLGYKIERGENTSEFNQIDTITGTKLTSYTDATVVSGVTYYYRVRAFTADGDSDPSTILSGTALYTSGSPTSFSASAVSSSEIKLSWTDNSSNETGFRIDRRKPGEEYAEIIILPANTTTYTDTCLEPSTKYYYKVSAMNGSTALGCSNEKYATTSDAATPAPTIVPTPAATPSFPLGDVNGDGSIDIVDALRVAQYYVGFYPAGFILSNADVNQDGKVNIVDALFIAEYYVGLLTSLPPTVSTPGPTDIPTIEPTPQPTIDGTPTPTPDVSEVSLKVQYWCEKKIQIQIQYSPILK